MDKLEQLYQDKEKFIMIMKELDYYEGTISIYSFSVGLLIDYLVKNDLNYNAESIDSCLLYLCDKNNKEINSGYYQQKKCIFYRFLKFHLNGIMDFKPIYQKVYTFDGPYHDPICQFIDYLHESLYSHTTISGYMGKLNLFNEYLYSNNIKTLDKRIIDDFFIQLKGQDSSTHKMYHAMSVLKKFFKYMFENNYTDTDLSQYLPKVKYVRSKELPSVFTTDEIKKILSSIDRESAVGKRNYAMITLAIRLGLRSSDVTGLKFSEIDWENNIINIIQNKTKRKVELPLLPEVGNAILDYLKNGRRNCNLPFVFITADGPLKPIHSSAFYTILNKYINKSIITNLEKRHHGPHSLRHSLASCLLKNEVDISTISAALGHSDTQVTTVYLSIDFESLKKCSIPMPKIKSSIYTEDSYHGL
ncbi:MAG: tyrosine-type recombinase/integrase [Coprobacillus cateniformis]|uniref:site-specific integrase n=1 Tax=Longibaculum muris TaxID=1796628 RepID=UPI003AB6B46F|nr:tyrosine-type recombinase/integrase [Coprobacillus cateniformis]